MTVKMTPEGLGEITIRVISENGKMNLQIATETAEAKKLLDSSISDLKNQLNAHRLSNEVVKVDVIAGTNTDQNVQTNLNHQQQNFSHQQTRQFWNQFNENFGNRSQREGYLDFSNSRRNVEDGKDPLLPIETQNRASLRAFENKGRGLNLVA
jgi:flagellar hook-length control protein FliK